MSFGELLDLSSSLIFRLANGEQSLSHEDDDMDGIEQLLDLVHIIILALTKHALWLPETLSRGRTS